jgi:hypothetical protein
MFVYNPISYAMDHIGYLLSALAGSASGALATLYRDSIAKVFAFLRNLVAQAYVRLGLYPIVVRRYRQSLIAKHSRIRMGYRDFEIDVSKQYIKLVLMPGFIPPFQRERDEPRRTTISIEEILRTHDDRKPLRLVILGQPGSGKTTLLQHLSLLYAFDGAKPTKKKLIPILLFLREAKETSLWDCLLSNFSIHKFPSAHDFLVRRLENGECLVLLDGLDELVEEDQRRVASEIRNLSILYDKNTFILTSRIEGYVRASEILFEEAEIAPLDPLDKETTSFVSGILEPSDHPERFLETLRSDENLRRLAESPLLLSLVLFIYKESKGQLPKNRTKIYKTFIQWMLRDRDETRGIYQYRNKFDAEDKELFLRKLAYSFFIEGSKEFTRDALLSKTYGLSQHLHMEKRRESTFLDEIVQNNGLLRHTHGDRYNFIHLTFQEYYVAKEIKEANRIDEAYAHIADPAWSEVILFLCGLADFQVTEQLIDFILDKTSDYVFAGRCLAHSSTAMTGPSQRIIPELLRNGSPEARRTLLEIGDNLVAASLCNVLRNPASGSAQVKFARDCLQGVSKQLISDFAIGAADEWLTRDCIGKGLQVLETFQDFTDGALNPSITRFSEMLGVKHRTALYQCRLHFSNASFTEAEAVARAYQNTEGISADFNLFSELGDKLRDSWTDLTAVIDCETEDEARQLKQIELAWDQLTALCRRMNVDAESFQDKLLGICQRGIEQRSYDRTTSWKWIRRARAVAPYRAEYLERYVS